MRCGKKETGLNPAACCENAWSGVKAIEKSEAWGEEGTAAAPVVVVLLPSPALQGLGWAVNVEGAVRGGAIGKRGWW